LTLFHLSDIYISFKSENFGARPRLEVEMKAVTPAVIAVAPVLVSMGALKFLLTEDRVSRAYWGAGTLFLGMIFIMSLAMAIADRE
jgi:membrane protein CcdC involved in cytochrome C biogenesis